MYIIIWQSIDSASTSIGVIQDFLRKRVNVTCIDVISRGLLSAPLLQEYVWEGEGSSLFLAQRLHCTPDLIPSLHSSVLHTDFSTSDVMARCEITRECGKESTCTQWNYHFASNRSLRLICGGMKTEPLAFSKCGRHRAVVHRGVKPVTPMQMAQCCQRTN